MKATEESGEATDKTKFPWVGLVRLIAAVAGSLIASCFLFYFTYASHRRFVIEHGDAPLSAVNEVLIAIGFWVYLFPSAFLLLGALLLWAFPKRVVMFQIVISTIWLSSLLFVTLPILYWTLQNVPEVDLRGVHF